MAVVMVPRRRCPRFSRHLLRLHAASAVVVVVVVVAVFVVFFVSLLFRARLVSSSSPRYFFSSRLFVSSDVHLVAAEGAQSCPFPLLLPHTRVLLSHAKNKSKIFKHELSACSLKLLLGDKYFSICNKKSLNNDAVRKLGFLVVILKKKFKNLTKINKF